jgi:hypothetical protein
MWPTLQATTSSFKALRNLMHQVQAEALRGTLPLVASQLLVQLLLTRVSLLAEQLLLLPLPDQQVKEVTQSQLVAATPPLAVIRVSEMQAQSLGKGPLLWCLLVQVAPSAEPRVAAVQHMAVAVHLQVQVPVPQLQAVRVTPSHPQVMLVKRRSKAASLQLPLPRHHFTHRLHRV